MKIYMTILTLLLSLTATSVHAEKFVDERFDKPLYPTAYHSNQVLYLTPTEIYYQDLGEKFQYDCQLLDNEIGYLKFKCTYVYSRKYPARIKGYQQIITFRIYKSELDQFNPKCDRVKEIDYHLDEERVTYMGNYCIYEEYPGN